MCCDDDRIQTLKPEKLVLNSMLCTTGMKNSLLLCTDRVNALKGSEGSSLMNLFDAITFSVASRIFPGKSLLNPDMA